MKQALNPSRVLALVGLGLLALPVLAQGVYRNVGPDGRVTFSDQPPASASDRPATGSSASGGTSAGGSASLPYELRQVTSKYPVTLYTGKDCVPCNNGRNLLNSRGIPYTEKTVSTADDIAALKRINGDGSLPLMTLGNQQIKGYSDKEWAQYLDAAGYPQQSKLPSSYRRPAPTPLVASVKTATPEKPAGKAKDAAAAAPAAVPVAPPVTNPAGIRF
jgi:glutaredoxin